MSPPEVKRLNLGMKPASLHETKGNFCPNCSFLKEYMDKKFKDMSDMITKQNEVIAEALSAQKVFLGQLVRQDTTNNRIRNAFPVKSIEDLSRLNNAIDDDNRELYIKTMKPLLHGRLIKTLTHVLSSDLILNINVEGMHGKHRLKDFSNFFNALLDAFRALGVDEAEKDLRNALKVIKKRHFHIQCVKRKSEKKEELNVTKET